MSLNRLLTFSSSRVGNTEYLENAVPVIKQFLGPSPLNIAFIPFASADENYDEYVSKVRTGLADLPHTIHAVLPSNARDVIEESDVIMVGGGNTFKLLHDLYFYRLIYTIRQKVKAGVPYIGWSAGSNIAGLTIGTTNDMPIIQPESFKALGFFPFQVNPHYINQAVEGFNGETRDQRLTEFMQVNPGIPIVGLPEGTALKLENDSLTFIGDCTGVLFEPGETSATKREIAINEDLSFLM